MSIATRKLPTALPAHGAYTNSIADKIARLNVILKRTLGTFARDQFDLSVVESRLVILIGIHAHVSVNTLASLSDIDRTQISRAIGVLSARNLVTKTSGDTDRRAVLVKLTRTGIGVHDQVIAFLFQHNSQLIAGLPPKSLEVFFSLMSVLIDRAQQLPLSASASQPE